jgi:hypothetical protein
MFNKKPSTAGSRLLKTGGVLVLMGVVGIFLGTNVFPESYWLGSGIIFGPLFLIGMLLIALGSVVKALSSRKEKKPTS